MVQADQHSTSDMGQATQLTEPFPSLNSVPIQSNGNTTETQATLSMLLATSHEFTADDLSIKLRSVINENFDLKENVMQNNLALNHQLHLLEKWNIQVQQQKSQSDQMIVDGNQKIKSLEKENQLLRSTLIQSKNSSDAPNFKELDDTITTLNNRIEDTKNELQKAIEEKELLLKSNLKLEGDNTLLKCSLGAKKSELEKLQTQRTEFIKTIRDLRVAMENEHCGVIKERTLTDQSENIPKLKRELENEQETTSTLMQELHATRNQMDNLEMDLKKAKAEATYYKTFCNEIAKSPTGSNPQAFENVLANERAQRNPHTDQYYQAKLKSLGEEHDETTAKLVSYEELLGSKTDEIARLKKELGKTKAQLIECHSEGETIAVLRAQVEVYQGDFRAEREAREVLATEREKLRDELRHLHARNTQIIDELQTYQRRVLPTGVAGRSSRGSSEEYKPADSSFLNADFSWEKLTATPEKTEDDNKKEEPQELDENLLYCPKCNKTFKELRPLEEHVNRCLDED